MKRYEYMHYILLNACLYCLFTHLFSHSNVRLRNLGEIKVSQDKQFVLLLGRNLQLLVRTKSTTTSRPPHISPVYCAHLRKHAAVLTDTAVLHGSPLQFNTAADGRLFHDRADGRPFHDRLLSYMVEFILRTLF